MLASTMKRLLCLLVALGFLSHRGHAERLFYHDVRTDAGDHLLPWYSADLGLAYDHAVRQVWQFWNAMPPCPNGVPYYLQHQVWKPEHDPRGLGGDQLAMALSSWNLLYAYTGDRAVVSNMVLIADFVLAHGLSVPTAVWPNLPYPYNTDLHSGRYDGDMRAGKGFTQPDKAASFASELVMLYKITGNARYLEAAAQVANTLAAKVAPGDADHSSWPFRVHAETGQVPPAVSALYTANYTGALRLFRDLIDLKQPGADRYRAAFATVSSWLKQYPMQTMKWGPFFEDVSEWSNTEINADTMATYLLEHPDWDPQWRAHAKAILDWTWSTFGTNEFARFGVTAIREQTAYLVPGNSHTSRHASVELLYAEKTGDLKRKAEAIRELSWATYTVDFDGRNRYPRDDIWLTDGYGDYVRHYLRAMAAAPELAPGGQDHLLRSSSAIREIRYDRGQVSYRTFDAASEELLRLAFTPERVTAGGQALKRLASRAELEREPGYTFEAPGDPAGVLRLRHVGSGEVAINRVPLP